MWTKLSRKKTFYNLQSKGFHHFDGHESGITNRYTWDIYTSENGYAIVIANNNSKRMSVRIAHCVMWNQQPVAVTTESYRHSISEVEPDSLPEFRPCTAKCTEGQAKHYLSISPFTAREQQEILKEYKDGNWAELGLKCLKVASKIKSVPRRWDAWIYSSNIIRG